MKTIAPVAAIAATTFALATPAFAHQSDVAHVHGLMAEIGYMMGHADFWLVAAAVAALAGAIAFAVVRSRR